MQSKATTALSSIDIQTLTFPDGTRGTFSTSNFSTQASISRSWKASQSSGEIDDSTSLMSCAPTSRATGDLNSFVGEDPNARSPAWKLLSSQADSVNPFETIEYGYDDGLATFEREFDEILREGGNEGWSPQHDKIQIKANGYYGYPEECLLQWKSKLKHYLILSSAGKPIYSRHGDQYLINNYIGIIQTIISFYKSAKDPLTGFTAGGARFVISEEGPLYLVAISKLGENDSQLRSQLDALYMQILSTLTLPTLTQLFTNRPSTDLRRPLQGTESLLSSLADSFTKGSASALLLALECLKIRRSQRYLINSTLFNARTKKLLYGLIVAGGRLVSVVRPKQHSLHPSDLQLIFNMLFESSGVRTGGGESWIPLCLPCFNNSGYLYMYVSFLGTSNSQENANAQPQTLSNNDRGDGIAILLISADKESFYELKKMSDEIVSQLYENGSMEVIKSAVRKGRPRTTDIVPGTQLRHFLYKSRANVQFVMPSFSPHFSNIIAQRRRVSLEISLSSRAFY